MINPKDSAFAFRSIGWFEGDRIEHNEHGIDARTYIATAALAGLLAADAKYNGQTTARDALAHDAVAHADALIAALNGEGGE